MSSARTRFSPQAHGFQFTNRFEYSPKFDLQPLVSIDLGKFVAGLCGGMCFSALDYFYDEKDVPSNRRVPVVGSDLREYLEKRQFISLLPPVGIDRVLKWALLPDRNVWRLTAGNQFRMLKTRLNRGEPAVLCLIRASGVGDLTRNHQVVARSYNHSGQSGRLRIGIYDPNHPRTAPSLSFDLSDPRRGIAPKQTTGEPLRGFFVIDYKKRRLPVGL